MKKPISFRGNNITIYNFTPVTLPWEQIEDVMGKVNTKAFAKWMSGQTQTTGGVYAEDLQRWLEGKSCID